MKKETRKLQLNRETLRELDLAANQVVGASCCLCGPTANCPIAESDYKACIPK